MPTQTPFARVVCCMFCVCVCVFHFQFVPCLAGISVIISHAPMPPLITILVAVESVIARAFASKLAVLGSCAQLPPKAIAQAA